ncbi:MAG TPA: hypothetical protein DCG75_08355 [Bacteroidales bacterium]|nr:hypothetical protein [Bacteroidales bacterium]
MVTSYKTKLKQKRGEGRGKNYIPWIKVGEFSGSGNSTRVLGLKSGREHHFLSNFEASLFYIFDLDNGIEDIREQFPLSDIELAKEIAGEAGIRYPSNTNDDNHVLTSDYFLTYTDGREVVLTIKYRKDLSERQLELFEIERRYWNKKGVQWKIVTEKEMPSKDLLLNYKDIHNALRGFIADGNSEEGIQKIFLHVLKSYKDYSDLSLPKFSDIIDFELNITVGSTLRFIKVLIAKGLITLDLTEPLTSSKRKMKDLNFKITNAKDVSKSDLAA